MGFFDDLFKKVAGTVGDVVGLIANPTGALIGKGVSEGAKAVGAPKVLADVAGATVGGDNVGQAIGAYNAMNPEIDPMTPGAAPAAPTPTDPATAKKLDTAAIAATQARGRAATLLSSRAYNQSLNPPTKRSLLVS